MIRALIILLLAAHVAADCYMHNPRGTNNRYRSDNNDDDDEVENNDRLFDSQNNNDGGYDHSEISDPDQRMQFYEGSYLTVEWSAQHACGADSNTHCQMVIQALIEDPTQKKYPRDGSSNDQVNFDVNNPAQSDDASRGMHEPWYNYHTCQRRSRNKGLFIADQDLNCQDSRCTRQEENGNNNRDGLECHEERDYYPHWAPSVWQDVAILVNDLSRCEYYWNTTMNTNSRYLCTEPDTGTSYTPPEEAVGTDRYQVMTYLTEQECITATRPTGGNYVWREFPPHYHSRVAVQAGTAQPMPNVPFWGAHDPAKREECIWFDKLVARGEMSQDEATRKCKAALGGPLCRQNLEQRDNHLGFITGGYFANFTWQLPAVAQKMVAVLRIRYNISTADYDPWNTFSESNADENTGEGSVIEQDQLLYWYWDYPIELALNTDQYGRTFQDRSHTFYILPRSGTPYDSEATIHNLNIRGKRGTIVQTYPSPTFSFVPKETQVKPGDYVHLQWEGGNRVPEDYFGGGDESKDRNNLVLIASMKHNVPLPIDNNADPFTYEIRKQLLMVGQNETACQSLDSLYTEHQLEQSAVGTQAYYNKLANIRKDSGNCFWLNQAKAYFGIEPLQFSAAPGTVYNFLSTRENVPNIKYMKGSIVVV